MRVKIWASSDDTEHLFADLRECFPDDAAGYRLARDELKRMGRAWIGGGADEAILLTVVDQSRNPQPCPPVAAVVEGPTKET